ncbi:MAG: carboxypeptidase-like regulatory domain-containing protein [Pseudomonadota bacterium]
MGSLAHTFIFAVGALLPVMATCASPAPPPPVTAASPSGPVARITVTGFIVNGVTARPLVGAIVELDGRPRAESGPDGRFRIDDVLVGSHLLTARAARFRTRIQPIATVVPSAEQDSGPRNDFIVLLFAPSAYFDGFPPLGDKPPCQADADCPGVEICLMNNFREMDAPACASPKICGTEADCKLGQQCEPVRLKSGEDARVCQGQPAPEVDP